MNLPINYAAALNRDGLTTVNKFGFQGAIATTSIAVWDRAIAYNYIPTATALKVTSGSTADTAAGTGAQTVQLFGLDANYNQINETVSLNGQTIVLTTQTFLRVFRAIVLTAGSGATNAGIIYAFTGAEASGVPSTATQIYAQISVGEAQTLMAVYTVPTGFKALMTDIFVAADSSQTITVHLVARPLGGIFNTKEKLLVKQGNTFVMHALPKVFDEKTDIELRAKISASTTDVAAAFDIILIPIVGT